MSANTRPPLNDPQTHAIFGAGIEVHRAMGHGFLENVYIISLAIEFRRRGIPFEHQVALPVFYSGVRLPVSFRVDFICFESIIVEVKALPTVTMRDHAQVMNYLKASGMHRGVLLNFGGEVLGKRRFVRGLPPESDPLIAQSSSRRARDEAV